MFGKLIVYGSMLLDEEGDNTKQNLVDSQAIVAVLRRAGMFFALKHADKVARGVEAIPARNEVRLVVDDTDPNQRRALRFSHLDRLLLGANEEHVKGQSEEERLVVVCIIDSNRCTINHGRRYLGEPGRQCIARPERRRLVLSLDTRRAGQSPGREKKGQGCTSTGPLRFQREGASC